MVVMPSASVLMPWPDHTEMEDMPKPNPKIIRISDNADEAVVLAKIAPQETTL